MKRQELGDTPAKLGSWEEAQRFAFLQGLRATPAQRFAWLEEMLAIAAASGALARARAARDQAEGLALESEPRFEP